MRVIQKIASFFTQKPWWQYLLLLILVASLFTYLQADAKFADPDSFYHAKMALLLAKDGAITQFPWLSFTILKYNFVDHHFLYHLFLVPFVLIFPPLVGVKVAAVLLASLFILVFFWFLRQWDVKGAFWYGLFLATINPFIFRLNLVKAQALVLIFLFIVIYLIFSRRYLSLILICCLYVWLYGGWPLALLAALIFAVLNFFWTQRQKSWWIWQRRKIKIYGQDLLLIVSVALGLGLGLFFSPYFPANLNFYWQQSFKIALVNYQSVIGVGSEWYPYLLSNLTLAAIPFFAVFIAAIMVFFINIKKQGLGSWFFGILAAIFFVLTLKSQRYVEYFIPLAVCFSALSLNVIFDWAKKRLNQLLPYSLVLILPLLLFFAISPVIYRDLRSVKYFYREKGFGFDQFAAASQWLADHSKTGDIVFQTDWDQFPLLFYHNDKNYYLVGLDPTFMYVYDPDLYQRWLDLVLGKTDLDLYQNIKTVFGAKYVFIDLKKNQTFDSNLAGNFYFEKVYQDNEAKIYQVGND